MSVNIKKESRLIGYIACEDAAGGGSFISQLIKLIILMADCNPERIVFMKHVTKNSIIFQFQMRF